jgi:hypothetical protein
MSRQDRDHQEESRKRTKGSAAARSGSELGAHEAYAFWQGMRDRPRSLGTGFLAGFLEDVFGISPKPYFRDSRLEAIRRLTICFRQGLSDQLVIELSLARKAGVSENQIAVLRSRIGRSPVASG